MGKLSKTILGAFNFNDDDDYDDDYDDYDDDYDDEYDDEPREKGGFLSKLSGGKKSRDFDDDYDEVKSPVPAQKPAVKRNGQEVCIFKPTSIEDSREITETLIEGKAVVINFEGLHVEISQRIIDFISGSCYALDGNLQKISSYIFIATPNSVDISGDFQELFGDGEGSFDISGFKSPLL